MFRCRLTGVHSCWGCNLNEQCLSHEPQEDNTTPVDTYTRVWRGVDGDVAMA
jgi:hypothetical protein